jgi:hypothetical protein
MSLSYHISVKCLSADLTITVLSSIVAGFILFVAVLRPLSPVSSHKEKKGGALRCPLTSIQHRRLEFLHSTTLHDTGAMTGSILRLLRVSFFIIKQEVLGRANPLLSFHTHGKLCPPTILLFRV